MTSRIRPQRGSDLLQPLLGDPLGVPLVEHSARAVPDLVEVFDVEVTMGRREELRAVRRIVRPLDVVGPWKSKKALLVEMPQQSVGVLPVKLVEPALGVLESAQGSERQPFDNLPQVKRVALRDEDKARVSRQLIEDLDPSRDD